MKRKLISICLAVMAAMELVSCGSTTTLTPATESHEVSNEADTDSKESAEQNEAVAPDDSADKNENAALAETMIYDENDISAVITGLSDGIYGKSLDITITNNSEQDISWVVDEIIINDITLPCAVAYTINAGKIGRAQYPIEERYLERYSITDIYTVQVYSYIMEDETNDHIGYCLSEKLVTNLGADHKLSLPDDWELVYDSDSMKIYYTGTIEEGKEYDDFKSRVLLMCYNDTDSMVAINPNDVSFDGVMDYNNYYSFSVGPEAYGEFYLACGEDATEKEEASFTLRVCDGKTYEEEYVIDEISIDIK